MRKMRNDELDELLKLSEVPKFIKECDVEHISKKDWNQRGQVAKKQEQQFKKLDTIFKKEIKNIVQEDKDIIGKFTKDMSLNDHSSSNINKLLIEEYAVNCHLKLVFNKVLEWYETEVSSTLDKTKEINKLGVIEVDMKRIVATNKSLDQYIAKVINRMIDMMDMVGGEYKSADYIYIVHRNDGMVAVVGRSSFVKKGDKIDKCGDLFSELNTRGLVGTEKIILRILYGNEMDSILANYYKRALVIPISSKLSKDAAYFEKSLGNYLLEEGIPILNCYSHQ